MACVLEPSCCFHKWVEHSIRVTMVLRNLGLHALVSFMLTPSASASTPEARRESVDECKSSWSECLMSPIVEPTLPERVWPTTLMALCTERVSTRHLS